MQRNNNGFTLVEILVVITVISLLSTIGYSGFQAITRSGRDGLRRADLEIIRSQLEVYKADESQYPANVAPGDCLPDKTNFIDVYITNYPADPKATSYKYCYIRSSALLYKLCAHLENGDSTIQKCDASDLCIDNCNYEVTNP